MVVKQYGGNPQRYKGCVKTTIAVNPRLDEMSTSMIERENLTIATEHRALPAEDQRLLEEAPQPRAAVALYVAHYNFCRFHETLKTTPAVASGVTDHIWSLGELIDAAMSLAPEEGAIERRAEERVMEEPAAAGPAAPDPELAPVIPVIPRKVATKLALKIT